MTCTLGDELDFKNQKGAIKETIDRFNREFNTEYVLLMLSKFRPELNWKEREWGELSIISGSIRMVQLEHFEG